MRATGKTAQKICLAATIVLLLGGGFGLYASGFFAACTSQQALQEYIAARAPYGQLWFFLLQLLSVVLAPIPSNITALAGGVIFGMWPAFLLTWGAVLSGSLLVFTLARVLGRSFADRMVSRRLSEKYQEVIRAKTDVFLILAFLFPYFPDDMLCILAGLTGIPFGRFALIVLLTRPWGLLVASALGGSTVRVPIWGLATLGAAGLAIFVLGMKYGDRVEQWVLRHLVHHREEPDQT